MNKSNLGTFKLHKKLPGTPEWFSILTFLEPDLDHGTDWIRIQIMEPNESRSATQIIILVRYLRPVAGRRNHFRQDIFLRQRWNGNWYRTFDQSPAGGTTSARMYSCANVGTEVEPYLGPVAGRRNHFRQNVFQRQCWNGSWYRTLDQSPAGGTTSARMYSCANGGTACSWEWIPVRIFATPHTCE